MPIDISFSPDVACRGSLIVGDSVLMTEAVEKQNRRSRRHSILFVHFERPAGREPPRRIPNYGPRGRGRQMRNETDS